MSKVTSPDFEVQNLESRNQNLRKLRILLWDIDGTLVIAPRGGAYKDYFAPAMQRVYGSYGTLYDKLNVSGMTDLQIAYEVLQSEGISSEDINAKAALFNKVLGEEINRNCSSEAERFVALPGVHKVLEATQEHAFFINSLLTGNLPTAAHYKLSFVGLDKFFDFDLGAFGNESHRREDLPAIAAGHFRQKFDYEFVPKQFIIIGDTPNDIACARAFGAKAVSVATGRNHPKETLVPYKPDYIFENLLDTANVLKILETI